MPVSLIEPGKLGPAEIERWRVLADNAKIPNPFFDPGYVLPAVAGLSATDVALLVACDESGWLACAPVQNTRGWRRVPVRALTTWRHPYGYLGMPLLARGREDEAMSALLAGAPISTFFGLDLYPTEAGAKSVLDRACAANGHHQQTMAAFERASIRRSGGVLKLPLKSKRRYELNRKTKKLAELLGSKCEMLDRRDGTQAAEDFLILESSGWKGREKTALASNPSHAEFFRTMCASFAQRGALRVFSLEAEGRPLAMLTGLVAGKTMFGFKIAFDEQFSHFSPGIQLHRSMVDLVNDDPGIDLIDTCAEPSNQTANRLYPDRVALQAIAIPAKGLRGSAARLTIGAAAVTRKARR